MNTTNRPRIFLTLSSTIIIVCLILWRFASLHLDFTSYVDYLKRRKTSLLNKCLSNISTTTTNSGLPLDVYSLDDGATRVRDSPVFLGHSEPVAERAAACSGNRQIVFIDSTQRSQYFVNGRQLTEGFWCVPHQVECNLKTSYVVASATSQVCYSKYPNMFGGRDGNQVVACNNELYPATGSTLWDHLYNEPVNPATVVMQSEDETLPGGAKPRFSCVFGKDVRANSFVPNPFNRFHPMRNFCTQHLYNAHPDVKLVVTPEGWHCDCGDPLETRVKQPGQSRCGQLPCTSCFLSKDEKNDSLSIPYSCFTLKSSLSSVHNSRPCQKPGRFSNAASVPCETFTLAIGEVRPESRLAPGLPFSLPNMSDIDNKSSRILST